MKCLDGWVDVLAAITLVALGTSMPDTFASKMALLGSKHADDAIGNINGSNSVNVFLGLGLPWSMAAIYHWTQVHIIIP
jgi:solute carrier family 8 (sodium/calcium exchanger)